MLGRRPAPRAAPPDLGSCAVAHTAPRTASATARHHADRLTLPVIVTDINVHLHFPSSASKLSSAPRRLRNLSAGHRGNSGQREIRYRLPPESRRPDG